MAIPKLLFVDDEANILKSIVRMFRKEEWEIDTTTNPVEAIEMAKQKQYSVVVSDYRMVPLVGTQVMEKIKEFSPDTVRIILTGYADVQASIDAINQGSVFRFLTKPWNEDEFRVTLKRAIEHYSLVQENKDLQKLTHSQNEELKTLNQELEKKVEERTAELRKSLFGAIKLMNTLTHLYDKETGAHTHRVAVVCKLIAVKLGLPRKEIVDLEIAAMLHDIGKLAIPVSVLAKARSFSCEKSDYELLRNHVTHGENLIKMISGFDHLSSVIRHHHEWYDGSGYPDGLAYDQIPLASRIIAVASEYDHFIHGKTDSEEIKFEKVIAELRARAHREFDPQIIEAFAQTYPDLRKHENMG